MIIQIRRPLGEQIHRYTAVSITRIRLLSSSWCSVVASGTADTVKIQVQQNRAIEFWQVSQPPIIRKIHAFALKSSNSLCSFPISAWIKLVVKPHWRVIESLVKQHIIIQTADTAQTVCNPLINHHWYL